MRRSFFVIISLLVTFSMLLAACAPASAPIETASQLIPETAPQSQAASATAPADQPQDAGSAQGGAALPEVDPSEVTGSIITAGSSTVYPLSEAVVNLFKEEGYTGEITIDSVGTGGGFERFCKSGESDIANASREIKASEVENCLAINRSPLEFRVGTDAMAVVVNPANDFLTDVSAADLALIFSNQAVQWSDVNPEWPSEPIKRYAPGTDSGTYDFFIEKVMQPAYDKDARKAQEAFQGAANLQASEDDNVLVQGIEGDRYAIGFFGYAYYQENAERLKVISIDGIAPTLETAEDGSYLLSRPLFIYSDPAILQARPQVAAFINFYLTRVNEVVEDVGYFPASEESMSESVQVLVDALE